MTRRPGVRMRKSPLACTHAKNGKTPELKPAEPRHQSFESLAIVPCGCLDWLIRVAKADCLHQSPAPYYIFSHATSFWLPLTSTCQSITRESFCYPLVSCWTLNPIRFGISNGRNGCGSTRRVSSIAIFLTKSSLWAPEIITTRFLLSFDGCFRGRIFTFRLLIINLFHSRLWQRIYIVQNRG